MISNAILDSENAATLTQETRQCFLYEEAPECLLALEQGIAQLSGDGTPSPNLASIFPEAIRAAHSLKGGAGIAGLPQLSDLAHTLEELLIALEAGRVPHLQSAYELLSLSLDLIGDLLVRAIDGKESVKNDRLENLISSVDRFVHDLPDIAPNPSWQKGEGDRSDPPHAPVTDANAADAFVQTAIAVDLEECLQNLSASLDGSENQPADRTIREALTLFLSECSLLGETLGLPQLTETATAIAATLTEENSPPTAVAQTAIARIRSVQAQILEGRSIASPEPSQAKQFPTDSPKPPTAVKPSKTDTSGDPIPERFLKYLILNPSADRQPQDLKVRIPLSCLDRLSDTVGDLLSHSDRLSGDCQHIERCIQELLALESRSPGEIRSAIARTRQTLQSTSAQMQDTVAQSRIALDRFNRDLTESRLIPFGAIADRFAAPLQALERQYGKQVELVVLGKEQRVDRTILEQLQTPLTHLFRNAFDHGIELPEQRSARGKSPTAKITFCAVVEGSQLAISVEDDGRGIDVRKVYDRALEIGAIGKGKPISLHPEELSAGEILQFLFLPGFSTASKVTDLSGRGVGLDIVQHQVAQLRGTLQVETELGRGTKFTIALPLTLSRVRVYLCRCGDRTLAIPADKAIAIENLSAGERDETRSPQVPSPIFSLAELLPYGTLPRDRVSGAIEQERRSQLGVVLTIEVKGQPIAIGVDAILEERQVMLKPLDLTVPVPPYVAGCTILATGEVVPVLAPHHFSELIRQYGDRALRENPSPEPDFVPHTPSSPPQILVVDDSSTMRRLLQQTLEAAGFSAIVCENGKQAWAQLQQSPRKRFDLILSDVEMPQWNGLQLLDLLRHDPQWQQVPVAMLSSRNRIEDVQTALQLGATAYFTKPFDPVKLVEDIEKLLALKG